MSYVYGLLIGLGMCLLIEKSGILDRLIAKKLKKIEQQLQADLKEQEAVWEKMNRESAINAAWFRFRHTSQRTRRKPAFKRIITHTPKKRSTNDVRSYSYAQKIDLIESVQISLFGKGMAT